MIDLSVTRTRTWFGNHCLCNQDSLQQTDWVYNAFVFGAELEISFCLPIFASSTTNYIFIRQKIGRY